MILSGQTIRRLGIISPCHPRTKVNGLTFGLGPAGYDVRLDVGDHKQNLLWLTRGTFCLAATVEHFQMPNNVLGRVHDKSTHARRGLTVQNTIIEPGWNGYLTLELTMHGYDPIVINQGDAVAQVVFEFLDEAAEAPYDGKYQNQPAGPQGARDG